VRLLRLLANVNDSGIKADFDSTRVKIIPAPARVTKLNPFVVDASAASTVVKSVRGRTTTKCSTSMVRQDAVTEVLLRHRVVVVVDSSSYDKSEKVVNPCGGITYQQDSDFLLGIDSLRPHWDLDRPQERGQ
jgi:hypothetical protein